MKIVINKCFGGFGLSPVATKRLAELQGRQCYFFSQTGFSHKGEYVPISMEEAAETLFHSAFDIPDPNEILRMGMDWHKMSSEQKEEHNNLNRKHSLYFRDIERTDPLLIQVIEELGDEANGMCAELAIIEIPDGIQWEIDEYDGMEMVDEIHRSWG